MRSVLHLVTACLLTVLVVVAAVAAEDKVSVNSVPQEVPVNPPTLDYVEPAAVEKPQKDVPIVEKKQNEAETKKEQEVKPFEEKPEVDNRNVQDEGKPVKETEAKMPEVTQRVDKPEDVQMVEKPEMTQKVEQPQDGQKMEKPEMTQRVEQTQDGQKMEKPEMTQRIEQPQDSQKMEKPQDSQRVEKPETSSKVTYNGAKVLRVVIQNKEQRKMLRQLENKGDINRWSGNGTAVDILIKQDSVINFLQDKKLIYDVIIEDLQKAIEEENPPIPQDEWSELEGRKGHRMTWQMYHRMTDIHGYIDYLTATYPDICSQEVIGHSVEGRPLKVLKISSGEANSKAMWVDSGIHAREWITPATSTYVISQMVENGDGTHGVDWYFLPLVNPDGYEHSHTTDRLWRKNRANPYKGPCAGTDLNRNFGYRWGGQGASQQPCRETYAGSGPFSEPETNAINKFVMSKAKDLGAYVSLHSYGQYILYPWGYDRKVPPDYSDLHRVGRSMAQAMRNSGGQIYRVGSSAATLYPASGGSDDWAKGTARIKYTYTIELRDTGRHGFVLPAQYIQPTAKEAYAALKTLANEVRQL